MSKQDIMVLDLKYSSLDSVCSMRLMTDIEATQKQNKNA